MNRLFGDTLAKRDFLISLGIWIALESVTFAFLPILGMVHLRDNQGWLLASLPLGIGGAFLVGVGSRFAIFSHRRPSKIIQFLQMVMASGISLLGILGIAFPTLVASIGIFTKIFSRL